MRETVEKRAAHMRKIPEKETEWAEKQFETRGYIYYQRIGNLVECKCGACGGTYIGMSKPSEDPFEAAAQHIIRAAHNKTAICERCGLVTKYKAKGKIRGKFVNGKKQYIIGQRMGKEEFVFRIFCVEQVMYADKKTEYNHTEYIRVFLAPGKKPQKDYYIYNAWTGAEYWIDHNLGGMANISIPCRVMVSPQTAREIRNTPMLKYIPEPGKEYGAVHYYIAAARYPDFEMIVKSGMKYLVNALVWGTGTGYRSRGKTHYDRLGIRKDRLKDLIEKKGDTNVLRAYQIEKRSGRRWNDEEIETAVHRVNCGTQAEIKTLTEVYLSVSPAKVERYLKRIIQNEGYGAFGEYIDYLRMRKDAGYDMKNEIILFPKELHRRHNEMVLETEVKKIDERKKEVLEKYPGIAEKYKMLSEKYSAAAAGYIIRPAKDAAEIVTEGRVLHHCVGGNMYLQRHAKGESVILFLRPAEYADTPFLTVEIRGEEILQWYGEYDHKPEEKYFDAWLKTYVQELKQRKKNRNIRKMEVAPVQQKGA